MGVPVGGCLIALVDVRRSSPLWVAPISLGLGCGTVREHREPAENEYVHFSQLLSVNVI